MNAVIGQEAPDLGVSQWVKGNPTNIGRERGRIVLVEVFQVNCPGCFLHAIPEAISIFSRYKESDVCVLGVATAFEDFDKNTLANLKLLAETGEIVGETKKALSINGQLRAGNKLPYEIPFPLGMDTLKKANGAATQPQIMEIIQDQVPNFDVQPEAVKNHIVCQVKDYLESKKYSAETFEKFSLKGTPSTIVVDRNGILRDVSFGQSGKVQDVIEKLL